jgi:glutamate 5-kinase
MWRPLVPAGRKCCWCVGAIALDVGSSGASTRPSWKKSPPRQSAVRLAHAWKDALELHRLSVAQILLTFGDTEERRRYLNARNTLSALLRLGAIPVINENDTVATAEIRYGDNDRLAARVAQMISADCLVLLSDVDGLYSADPRREPDARFIPDVHSISLEIERMAGGTTSAVGSGGMATKIAAAKIAVAAGCHMAVALGRELHPLRRIQEGERCTWFHPSVTPATVRKQWIAGALSPRRVTCG